MEKPIIASYLEHTLIRPDTTLDMVKRLLAEAQEHKFAAVCIPPIFVRDARRILGDENQVKLSTVVGFPLGYGAIASKSEEIKRAVDEGTDELDAVINLAAFKTHQGYHVQNDIESMIRAAHLKGRVIKIVLETPLLSSSEILELSKLAINLGAQYIRTGTGFYGATSVETVRLLKKELPKTAKIKVAGGISTLQDALSLVEAGATRIGTSRALQIASESR